MIIKKVRLDQPTTWMLYLGDCRHYFVTLAMYAVHTSTDTKKEVSRCINSHVLTDQPHSSTVSHWYRTHINTVKLWLTWLMEEYPLSRQPRDDPCQTLRNHLLQDNLVQSSGAKSCCSHTPIRKIISNLEKTCQWQQDPLRTQLKMLPNISHIRLNGNEYVHYTQHAETKTRQNPKANCINPAGGSPTKLFPFQKWCSCFEHNVGSRRNLVHQHYNFDTVDPSSSTPRSVLHGYLAIPCVQVYVLAVVEDNGHDHSHSQLTTTKRWQKKKLTKDKLDNLFRLDFLRLEEKWPCICAGKHMRFTRDERLVKNLGCCFFNECPCCSCLNFSGRSTFTRFRDDTKRMVVIFCVVFILVVGVSRVCGLLVCCWLGWVVSRARSGRGSSWLFGPVFYEIAFHISSCLLL